MKTRTNIRSWFSMILALTCLLYSVPPVTVFGSSDELVDFAKGLAYETNWEDSEFNGGHEDPDHTKLTDDASATSIWSPEAIHFRKRESGEPVTLTFDLGQARNLHQVEICGVREIASGVGGAVHYQVEYFDQEANDWITAGEDTPSQMDGVYAYTVDLPGTPVLTQKVRISVTPDSALESTFLSLTDIRIFGEESGTQTGPETPSFIKNLPSSQEASTGDAVTLSVEASVSDGGTLSYQWYKDGSSVGANSPEFIIESVSSADSGSYQVEVTNTLDGKTAQMRSTSCTLTVSDSQIPDDLINFAKGLVYETNWEDSEYNAGHEDPDHTKLTDDTTTDSIWNADAVHYRKRESGDPVVLTFDLNQKQSLYQVEIAGVDGGYGVFSPTRYQVEYYDEAANDWVLAGEGTPQQKEGSLYQVEIAGVDGGYGVFSPTRYQVEYYDEAANDWVLAGEGTPQQKEGPFTYTVELPDAPVSAQQVRISVTPASVPESTYLCLTDIRILGVETGPQKPTLTKDLSASVSANVGDAITLSVEASVSDGGTLSYQWYKDDSPIGENSPSYSIEAASLSDRGNYAVTITNTLDGETSSIQSTVCALNVIDLGADAVAPVIDTDLFSRKSATEGDQIAFEIAASSTDGGALSYQWYKDGSPVGENSPQFIIESATLSDSGEYWVEVTNTKGDTSATAESNICTLTVNEKLDNLIAGIPYITELVDENYHETHLDLQRIKMTDGAKSTGWNDVNSEKLDNLIAGIPYITELVDENYHETHLDLQRIKMTDGAKSTGWNDVNSVGIHTGTVPKFSMEFDLEKTISFQQVNIGMLQADDVGIPYPAAIQVERKLSAEDGWDVLYTGDIQKSGNGRFEVTLTANGSITADRIRITFTGGGSWTFLDEIEVFSKAVAQSPYGKLELTDDPVMPEGNNLALGKPYEANHPADIYTDTDGKELTDGKYAGATVQDPAWVGYNYWHDQGKKNAEVILDLQKEENFREVRMNLLRADGVAGPSEIHVYISNSKSSGWQELKEKTSTFDVILDLGSIQSFERVKAGFLKADGIPENGIFNYIYTSPQPLSARYVKVEFVYDSWVFLDEIEVLKEPLPREAAQPEQAPAEITDPDPNNIAFGCDYETQWNFMPLMPDNGGKLTDGRRGAPSPDANEWTAYNAYEGAGGYKSFNAFQSQYPTAIKVEYSDDKVNWKNFTGQNLNWSTAPSGIQRFDYGSSTPVSGRYVKLTMTMDQIIALDEIEVLKTNDGLVDAEIQPDNGRTYNLISGYDVALSHVPNAGSVSFLTDGFYGQWAEFDSSSSASDNHVVMDVDLTSFNSVSQILLHTKNGSGIPENVVFKVSSDNSEWITLKTFEDATNFDDRSVSFLWQGGVDSFYSNLEGASKVYTRYLRVEFDIPYGKTAAVDELEVIGKRGKCSDAGLAMNLPGEHYNMALGKPYTVTPANIDNTYPDTGGTELTDGIRGSDSLADPAWFGFKGLDYLNKYDLWPIKTIIVDLQDVKTITSLQFNMKGGNKPWRILTFASMDGKQWTPLSENRDINIWLAQLDSFGWHFTDTNGISQDLSGADMVACRYVRQWTPLSENRDINIWLAQLDSFGWHFTDTNGISQDLSGADMVACRYVRIDIEVCNWNTIDEIEIMGYDGVKDGALIAEGGRELENGREYLVPSEETTGGIHDLVLCYNGWYGVDAETQNPIGDWSPEQYKPYLTYVNADGKSVDTMFDGVLLLGLWSQYGRPFTPDPDVGNPQIEDWLWYFDKTFKEGGDIDNLNEAAKQASIDLGDPNYKVKLVLTIPEVPLTVEKFGTLNGRELDIDNLNEAAKQASIDLGDPNYKVKLVLTIPEVPLTVEKFGTLNGRELNLTREEDWKYLISWWLDKVITEMESRNYEYIDFAGIYWLAETLGTEVEPRLYAADLIHDAGYHFYWIPYFFASGTLWADKAGFDAVALQPNHFFDEPMDAADLIHDAGYHFYWIPYFFASGTLWADKAGFDAVALQPNHFFDEPMDTTGAGAGGTTRVDNAAKLASYGQIGIEMEFDNRIMDSPHRYNQYLDYLNCGVNNGFDGPNVYRAWYQGQRDLYPLAYAKQQQFRDLYDYTYQFMKGTLTNTIPHIEEFSDAPTDGSIGQGGSIGGGSGGGSSVTPDPDDKPDPETPPTGDENYTWEETDDGYQLTDKDGEIVTGWAKVDGKWYYLNDNGIRQTGWQKVDNKWYYLKKDGVMATGWLKLGNVWYFLNGGGVMQTGWLYNGGAWYYLYD